MEDGINDTANKGSTDKQTGRRLKRIAVVAFKTCWLNSFSKFLFVACRDCYNAWGTYFGWQKAVILSITGNYYYYYYNNSNNNNNNNNNNYYYYYRSFVSLLLLLLLGAS